MSGQQNFFDLYDFRRRVVALYRERNEELCGGGDQCSALQRFRAGKDHLFATHPQSPVSTEEQGGFGGLSYYPFEAGACVRADVEVNTSVPHIRTMTTGEGELTMRTVATLRFSLDGHRGTLTLYWIDTYGGGLFLPFHDATAPEETYGGGRYLFDTMKGSDWHHATVEDGVEYLTLDFNYAYNPSCAYDARWLCPLAPRENQLSFPVPAGEKRYPADH